MVSFIQSNYQAFGSGIVIPGTGIAMQNQRQRFLVGSEASELRRACASGRITRSFRVSSPTIAAHGSRSA